MDCVTVVDPNPPEDKTISEWTEWSGITLPYKIERKSVTGNEIKPDTCSIENPDPANCNCAAGVTAPTDGCGTGTIPVDYRKCTGADCDWSQQER